MKIGTCPCCGYQSLGGHLVEDYSICPICFWENDPVQNENPDYEGGANNVSLRVGQHNFLVFGACEPTMKAYVRPPLNDESKDPSWKPIE